MCRLQEYRRWSCGEYQTLDRSVRTNRRQFVGSESQAEERDYPWLICDDCRFDRNLQRGRNDDGTTDGQEIGLPFAWRDRGVARRRYILQTDRAGKDRCCLTS